MVERENESNAREVNYSSPGKCRISNHLREVIPGRARPAEGDTLLCSRVIDSGAVAGGAQWLSLLRRKWLALVCLSST